uniref:GRF-type domain-containing protein n=1 Tax=Brassica oleracea var. oleracea TaxID=109376 RepID=A0A0D3BTW3_BRAOL
MTSSSTSSARFPRFSTHGVPTRCWCGEGITTFGYSTVENRYRRFYRCEIARDRKTENHLFKWIDEALIKEIRMVDAKHERVALGITKFEERVMEKVKS